MPTLRMRLNVPGCAMSPSAEAHHHGLSCGEVWQQHVFLHDVAGHFPECPQVPGFPIYQDLTLHPCFPGQQEGHTHV